MNINSPEENALSTELDLLMNIYPEISFDSTTREVKYGTSTALLLLRLPDGYPLEKPTVLVARIRSSGDVRERVRSIIEEQAVGEAMLDVIFEVFQDLACERGKDSDWDADDEATAEAEDASAAELNVTNASAPPNPAVNISDTAKAKAPPKVKTPPKAKAQANATPNQDTASKTTTIIWLHHLLAPSKRKKALSPPSHVKGLIKPGYP
ncbi:MAG: hypothetical protein Q9162_006757, partial [Coniocarpon cinnabarinum]